VLGVSGLSLTKNGSEPLPEERFRLVLCFGRVRKKQKAKPQGSNTELVAMFSGLWSKLSGQNGRQVGHAPPNWNKFLLQVERHYLDFPVLAPTLPGNVPRVEALQRDGFVVIENLVSPDELAQLKKALAHDMVGLRKGQSEASAERKHFFPELGRYRLYRIDQAVPETLMFRDHPVLVDLVRAYLSDQVHFIDLVLELRSTPPNWDEALIDCNPHCDHVFREVKIYLALDDITDDNGPIVYWTGSHRRADWRKLPDYLASIGGLWGESHILNHVTMQNLLERCPELSDCRKVRCTVKAGSCFAVDTRGVHRASYLNTGERWHIYSAFAMEGFVRAPVPNPNWLQPLDLS
jgi:ectoine hydroxylase-related dioxygenase (phytanoyl-CoA dioxygenase family)